MNPHPNLLLRNLGWHCLLLAGPRTQKLASSPNIRGLLYHFPGAGRWLLGRHCCQPETCPHLEAVCLAGTFKHVLNVQIFTFGPTGLELELNLGY